MAEIIRPVTDRMFSPATLGMLADLLDNRFKLPGIPFRVGWDFIIGLLPVAGDTAAALSSLYIVIGAVHHRARTRTILRMLSNILLDFVIGLVPLIGDLFDGWWKANVRNVRLLMKEIEKKNNHPDTV